MARFPLVYCLNTRPWLNELRELHGPSTTLATVPDAQFREWERLGFSHIWLLGVWETGPRVRAVALNWSYGEALDDCREEDIQGSPFAVADYRVAKALGGDAGLAEFRKRLHRHGLKLMLDFVPNHLGLDHRWVRARPELFVNTALNARGAFGQKTRSGEVWLAHGRDPNFPPWTDTVQLDYRRADTRRAMTELLISVCHRCEAVRCDMAMLVLGEVIARVWPATDAATGQGAEEFWPSAIGKVKALYPECLFLAEAYWGLERKLQEQGFDYAYDKVLYDWLMAPDAAGVQGHLRGMPPGFVSRSAHFIENHDEVRVSTLLSPEAHRAAAFLMLCLPGLRLLHDGQLIGARVRTPVQLVRRCHETVDVAVKNMYETLLMALRSTPVGQGTAELLEPVAWEPGGEPPRGCILVSWQTEPEEVVVAAVNLDDRPARCGVVPGAGEKAVPGTVRDLLPSGNAVTQGIRWHGGRLMLDLAAFEIRLLEVKRH